MICPKCGKEDIVFFLRHQDREDDAENVANCITILCKECGHNESFFLIDCLDYIFPDWSELGQRVKTLEEQAAASQEIVEEVVGDQEENVEAQEETDSSIGDDEN